MTARSTIAAENTLRAGQGTPNPALRAAGARGICRLLLLCAFLYLLTSGAHFSSTDEEDLYHNTAILAARLLPVGSAAQPADGPLLRGPQEIGQSLLALPWYWLGQTLATQQPPHLHAYLTRAVMTTFNIVITLLAVTVLYRWASALASEKAALLTAALYGLTTLAWPYSHTFYREPLVALCLLLAFSSASRFRRSRARAHLLMGLAAMIIAVATKLTALIAAPWFLLLLLPAAGMNRRHLRRGALALLLLLAVAALVLPAKWPTLLAYAHELQHDARHFLPQMVAYGLHGLLTSPGKGLIVTAPTVLLAFAALPALWRNHRREALALVGLFLSFLLVYSTRRGWHGGASWGPRYLLPALPLLMLPVVSLFERLQHSPPSITTRLVTTAAVTLMLCGFAVQVAAVSIFHQNFYQIKMQQGVVHEQNLDGGRTYLQELHFHPAHSPVWGQARLFWQRSARLLHGRTLPATHPLPATPDALWRTFITRETLDFWWLHLQ